MSLYTTIEHFRKLDNAKGNFEIYTNAVEQADMLLSKEMDHQFLFELLSPTVTEITSSETGAVYVKIGVSQPVEFNIFDNVPAYVDGVIKVAILNENQIVGETFCPIDYSGTKTLVAVCCNVSQQSENYQVILSPYYMVAIEKTSIMHK